VVRPYFRSRLAVIRKGDESPVTVADREAERAMRIVLSRHFPTHGILGEEFGLEREAARLRWVLDPIDGTRAFITGRPLFGTLVGLLDGDTPILGLIDQPVTGERWVAAAGRPTAFRGPLGGTAGCRPCSSLSDAELACTSPQMFGAADLPRFQRLANAAGRVSYGGDCYCYGLLALGQIDAIAEADLKVWDWAALAPVIAGAGGSLTDWQGRPLRVDGDGRVLALGDKRLLDEAVRLLA
jgi:myo-inositol-1(or 4)-monophosphatase